MRATDHALSITADDVTMREGILVAARRPENQKCWMNHLAVWSATYREVREGHRE